VYVSDDDLLRDEGVIDASVVGVDFLPHITFRAGDGPFRMPIRIGPHLVTHALEIGSSTAGEIDFVSIGAALEFEPEIDFFRRDRSALSLYGRLRAGAGVAFISTDVEDYDSDSTSVAGEVGLRYQIGGLLLVFGVMANETAYDESDFENGTFVEEIDHGFRGVFIGGGTRW
jgi:hypothetical protein